MNRKVETGIAQLFIYTILHLLQEDGHEMHVMGTRGEIGWGLHALNHGLRSDGSVMSNVDRGDPGMVGGMHVDRNDMSSRMDDLGPAMGIGVG